MLPDVRFARACSAPLLQEKSRRFLEDRKQFGSDIIEFQHVAEIASRELHSLQVQVADIVRVRDESLARVQQLQPQADNAKGLALRVECLSQVSATRCCRHFVALRPLGALSLGEESPACT